MICYTPIMDNYVVCGKLFITDKLIVKDTVYSANSVSALVKKLGEGGYKNITEITNTENTINNVDVDNLILINFNCDEMSGINVSGEFTYTNYVDLE